MIDSVVVDGTCCLTVGLALGLVVGRTTTTGGLVPTVGVVGVTATMDGFDVGTGDVGLGVVGTEDGLDVEGASVGLGDVGACVGLDVGGTVVGFAVVGEDVGLGVGTCVGRDVVGGTVIGFAVVGDAVLGLGDGLNVGAVVLVDSDGLSVGMAVCSPRIVGLEVSFSWPSLLTGVVSLMISSLLPVWILFVA